MKNKTNRIKAENPKGFKDYFGNEVIDRDNLLDVIKNVYYRFGFDPLETSAIEYSKSLGKFLPDIDRPNGGVYSWVDDENHNLSLRYDLTAPLARVFSQFQNVLPLPYRRYSVGPVWRNEKPGPGRFRQFYQCDADTVGTNSITSDAEMSLVLKDIFQDLGFSKKDFLIKINNRKILNGIIELIKENNSDFEQGQNMSIMRAIDKYDRLGIEGVKLLLTEGRKDESGDFTQGANLSEMQAQLVVEFLKSKDLSNEKTFENIKYLVKNSAFGLEGLSELENILNICNASENNSKNIIFDPTVVRGLGYYTGPVIEAELIKQFVNEKGKAINVGSVAGGGRYDNLVKRFLGQDVPATGVSIGVDRLLFALSLNKSNSIIEKGPILVTVIDRNTIITCQNMVDELRSAGIRAELYHGNSKKLGKQLGYADSRNSFLAIIYGEDEQKNNTVQVKDLNLGNVLSKELKSNDEWKKNPSQITIKRDDLVKEVKSLISK